MLLLVDEVLQARHVIFGGGQIQRVTTLLTGTHSVEQPQVRDQRQGCVCTVLTVAAAATRPQHDATAFEQTASGFGGPLTGALTRTTLQNAGYLDSTVLPAIAYCSTEPI